jgi:hypothetical protein
MFTLGQFNDQQFVLFTHANNETPSNTCRQITLPAPLFFQYLMPLYTGYILYGLVTHLGALNGNGKGTEGAGSCPMRMSWSRAKHID